MNEAWQYLDPMDRETVLWRYFNPCKLESMMATESLHFARAEVFEDDLEGRDPQGHRILFPHPDPAKSKENFRIDIDDVQAFTGRILHVLCWNGEKDELPRMWEEYLDGSNGVAIQTTVGRLWNSFHNPRNIGIGPVTYVPHDIADLGTDSGVMKYFFKRSRFDFEKEVRLIWSDNVYHGLPGSDNCATFGQNGVFLRVNIGVLIERISVNARQSDRFYKEVLTLAAEHRLAERVGPSPLFGN